MARLATFGFEEGNLDVLFSSYGTSDVISGSATARTGDWCLRLWESGDIARTYPISTEPAMFIGMAHQHFGAVTLGAVRSIVALYDLTNTVLVQLRLTTDRKLLATVGSSTNVATGTSVLPMNQYVYIEMYTSIDNSTGTFAVKVDGVQEINFIGDTQPGANFVISTVEFTCAGGDQDHYLDDVVINSPSGNNNNTWPGIVRLLPDYPNNSGSATQLSRGGTDTGQNYSQVNEVPYSASQYVYGNAVDQEDLYNIQDPTIPANAEIKNIIVNAIAKVDSGAGMIALMAKSGAVQSQGSDKSIGISDKLYQEVWNIDPSTSGTWSAAAINNLEIGVKIR